MKKILNTIFLATFLFAAACSDGYDDTRIKKDLDDVGQILDELEQAVDGLRTQMDALTQLINSSFVSLISTDAEGNYVITYIDRGGESRTLTLATQKEVVTRRSSASPRMRTACGTGARPPTTARPTNGYSWTARRFPQAVRSPKWASTPRASGR